MIWASTGRSSISCRTLTQNAGELTEDLIWAPETECHLKLGHKLSVLFTTFASHLDCQWDGQKEIVGYLSTSYWCRRADEDFRFLEDKTALYTTSNPSPTVACLRLSPQLFLPPHGRVMFGKKRSIEDFQRTLLDS